MVHFLDRILDVPRYGFVSDGKLIRPSLKQIFSEWLWRMNVISNRKHWLSLFSWFASLICAVPLFFFFKDYFSFGLLAIGFVYSMVLMGSHGTMWLHRYGSHRAFSFRGPISRMIFRNLVIRMIPEEVYVISHQVHHRLSEKPGDPYNVHGGFWYCLLSDANHQAINPDLSPEDYATACKMINHMGIRQNTYKQYQYWGTISHPLWSILHYVANWGFWYGIFFLLGGHPLAMTIFGSAGVWGVGVRTFNYEGHGKGQDKRRAGIDFNQDDRSINQIWPGYVAGEWHNNHHLFPNGARSGFLRYQLDLPWYFLLFYQKLGGIISVKDYKDQFIRDYYEPYLRNRQASQIAS